MSGKQQMETPVRVLWLSGIAAALAVHAIGLYLFQLGTEEDLPGGVDHSFLSLPSLKGQDEQGDLLQEKAYLFDSAPLFLPTRWNAASSPVVEALEERPAALFESFPARLSYREADLGLETTVGVAPESALRSLEAFASVSHSLFGQAAVAQPELSARFALLEVVKPSSGEIVLTVPVSASEDAPAEGRQLWEPAEFLVQVEAIGLLGEPALLRGSGVEEVDLHLREALRGLIGKGVLAPGYYRVLAGP